MQIYNNNSNDENETESYAEKRLRYGNAYVMCFNCGAKLTVD